MLHPDLEIGVVFPQIERAGDADAVRRIGAAAEDLGFDHLHAYDHVLGVEHADRDPELWGAYDEDDPFHDPFMLFSYLAGRTERLRFCTAVLILPQRQTALVARQAADLAILSDDRFRMGVGVGWNWVEYEALGQDFHTRGKRLDEQIDTLRRLWRDKTIDQDGRFDTVRRAGIPPRPARLPEIWIGGFGDAAFGRCARTGDGFLFGGSTTAVLDGLTQLRSLAADHGRRVGNGADEIGAESMMLSKKGPADLVAKMQAWADAGGTHTSVVTMGLGLDSTDAHVDYISRVAEALQQG
ncbi:LLM class F420-dependent oxidoreductase [Actinospongicola halichondriae]|uniref:LLM class F420-dependent oxidoreductase n=1 Tax=Actinospongicola halichondriae TaxID=3236844 RepID=UPI003D4E4570